jgi:class 3 adenylate cyclase
LGGHLRSDESFERRRITVLFAHMVGFTDLAEGLEPEELAEVLNGFLREMTAAVIACGGSVDNLIGDAVMAVFGAPRATPRRTRRGPPSRRRWRCGVDATNWPYHSGSAGYRQIWTSASA